MPVHVFLVSDTSRETSPLLVSTYTNNSRQMNPMLVRRKLCMGLVNGKLSRQDLHGKRKEKPEKDGERNTSYCAEERLGSMRFRRWGPVTQEGKRGKESKKRRRKRRKEGRRKKKPTEYQTTRTRAQANVLP
jgi:hypothetical protein